MPHSPSQQSSHPAPEPTRSHLPRQRTLLSPSHTFRTIKHNCCNKVIYPYCPVPLPTAPSSSPGWSSAAPSAGKTKQALLERHVKSFLNKPFWSSFLFVYLFQGFLSVKSLSGGVTTAVRQTEKLQHDVLRSPCSPRSSQSVSELPHQKSISALLP